MNNAVFVRSHVERCLQDAWELCRVTTDPDGDYPFRAGTAACYVSIEPDATLVRIFAIAADGLRSSGKLLAEINDVNTRSRTARVVLIGPQLHVVQTLPAAGCTAETLAQTCEAVATVANDIGSMIGAVFGGVTPYTQEQEVNTVGEIE